MPAAQFAQPGAGASFDDHSTSTLDSSPTASSATATDAQSQTPSATPRPQPGGGGLRSRSQPNLPSSDQQLSTPGGATSTALDAAPLRYIPSARKLVLRPISEALPPQASFTTKLLRSIPIVSWFVGGDGTVVTSGSSGAGSAGGGIIGDGPVLKEDGSWDEGKNGLYWSFWRMVDRVVGSDFCGLRDD